MAKKGFKIKKIGKGRNDLCACGSGKKYKNCCRLVFRIKTDEELAEEKRISNLKRRAHFNEQSAFLNYIQCAATVSTNRFDKGTRK